MPDPSCNARQRPGEAGSAAFAWFGLFDTSRVARSAMDH